MSGLFAGQLIPLEVYTQEHDLGKVREAVRGGFLDVVGSPTVAERDDYLKIRLMANGFITMQEHFCEITFEETLDGLKITAVPYDMVEERKIEVEDFATRKGVYLMIEGAAEELNYEVEMHRKAPDAPPGFQGFTVEMRRLKDLLEEGKEPMISLADYPRKGRVCRIITPNYTGMVLLEEDPDSRRQDRCRCLWVIQEQPRGEGGRAYKHDAKVIKDWLKALNEAYLEGEGPRIDRQFFGHRSELFSTSDYALELEVKGTNAGVTKILRFEELPSLKESKAR